MNIRALIVDDSPFMRMFVANSLHKAGIDLSAIEAANGAEALALLAENRVDLILCDIDMPVMDGLEFVKALAAEKHSKGVPVVMITANGGEKQVLEAISLGAAGYIRKPFGNDEVKRSIIPLLAMKTEKL